MKDKLRELAGEMRNELCSDFAQKLEAILDAEGDGGAVAWLCDARDGSNCDAVVSTHARDTYANAGRTITPLYTHPARSGVVRDEDVDLAVLAHHTWCKDAGFTGYVTCRGAMRAALEHFAKGSSEDVRDAPELFSGTKDALSNLSIHKSYQEKTS